MKCFCIWLRAVEGRCTLIQWKWDCSELRGSSINLPLFPQSVIHLVHEMSKRCDTVPQLRGTSSGWFVHNSKYSFTIRKQQIFTFEKKNQQIFGLKSDCCKSNESFLIGRSIHPSLATYPCSGHVNYVNYNMKEFLLYTAGTSWRIAGCNVQTGFPP